MKNKSVVQALGWAAVFSAVSTLVVATLEAFHTSVDASGGGVGSWLATAGLWVAPSVVVTTIGALLVRWLLGGVEPDESSDASRVGTTVTKLLSALVPSEWVGLLLVLVWGRAAVELLTSELPLLKAAPSFGAVVLLSSVGAAWVLHRWGVVFQAWISRTSTFTCSVLLALPWLLFLSLVSIGETSGVGGAFSLWGVLRREELDLSLPLYAAILFAGAILAASLPLRSPLAVSAVAIVAMFGLGIGSRSMTVATALEIEQSAAFSKRLLKAYQAIADRDDDGFAASFGGGDCNDDDAAIQPDARDIAGNGVDEDCSGNDAKGVDATEAKAIALGSGVASAPGVSASGDQAASLVGGALTTEAPANVGTLPQDANIVFITIDTLRYDLGYAGNPRPLSPNLDKLAAKALVYDNAYALASYTSKSLGPLMIGRYGSETNRGWMHFNKYPESDTMVQERLSRAGIFTISVQGHWYFKADTGLGRGFDVLDMSAAPTRPQGEGDKTVNSEQLSDAAIALLKQPSRSVQRFFLWVHYLDPHAEYVTHADFNFGTNGRAKYDAEIAFTDHHVGRVLAAIESADFGKRTIIVVTSDHGEAFGEHGLIRHGFELWEELIHVPLIVYVPGAEPRHVAVRRSAIDLVPTFLDVFGVALPQGDDFLSGQSLKPEWSGGASPQRPVFVDMPAGPYNGDRQAYIENDLKLVVSNSRPMGLYNLASDPGETQNLSKQTEQVDAMLERLKSFRDKLRTIKVKPQ